MGVKFTVPRLPKSLNKLLRAHWAVRSREKNDWMYELWGSVSWTANKSLREWVNGRIKTRWHIHQHRIRMFDPDNLVSSVKPILDAAQAIGFLYQDSPEAIELHVSQEKCRTRKEQRTVISVEAV